MSRIDWGQVVEEAARIVESYDTGVTLRQCFYRLVSAQLIPNTTSSYKRLSAKTAEARREGWFPAFIDRGRAIHQAPSYSGPKGVLEAALWSFRRDRTEGQDVSLYIGVEKAGMVIQLQSWFNDRGLPILALGGYSSQTYVTDIVADVERRRRPAVLLYAGDFDPSGEDIDRDLIERAACFAKVHRVGLSAAQVEEYGLPENPGKTTDSRSKGFEERHGRLVQVELDALPPTALRDLYEAAVADYWDMSTFEISMEREAAEREQLEQLVAGLGDA